MSDKPTAILIGDSICMGYRPLVKQRLAKKIDILGIEGNGGDSGCILENLDEWMIKRDATLIHLNCGLHDLKFERDKKAHQQLLKIYQANLNRIVERLKNETAKRLVWATTTPVIDERHNAVKEFDRYLGDVEAYNRAATTIMREAGIPINDLYSAIQNDDVSTCLGNDGVHITDRGNRILTEAVCEFLLHQLNME